MAWGNTIRVPVDVDDVLDELSRSEVLEHFGIQDIEDYEPIELLKAFLKATNNKRPMSPDNVKECISNWIDDNLTNWI